MTAGALIWGTAELPKFGVSHAPIHQNTAPKYIEDAAQHKMPPNMVTGVLADYRGYDTLGETTVIFTGGIGVMLIMRGRRRKSKGSDAKSKSRERSA